MRRQPNGPTDWAIVGGAQANVIGGVVGALLVVWVAPWWCTLAFTLNALLGLYILRSYQWATTPGGFKYSAAWWFLLHPVQWRQGQRYRKRLGLPISPSRMAAIRKRLDDDRSAA